MAGGGGCADSGESGDVYERVGAFALGRGLGAVLGARQSRGHLNPSFSRILTSPRFATSALGKIGAPADWYGSTLYKGD
jgi:hypothetical protein